MNDYTEILRGALQRGESLDASLALLRQQGANRIESVKAVREVNSVSLSEAKRIVFCSPSWEDQRESHDALVGEILAPSHSMKFSIRDLMFVTVIVAILVAWAVHDFHWIISERMHRMSYQEELLDNGEELTRLRNRIAELEKELSTFSTPAPSPPKK